MDLQGFNKLTYPNFFAPFPTLGTEYKEVRGRAVPSSMEPARDPRYPAFSGITADARHGTDYRPHCANNLPVGTQFMSKQWMVSHTDSLIGLSRSRQSEWSGAGLPQANTVPPPATLVFSSPFENEILPTNYPGGIGMERTGAATPYLFGTFVIPPTAAEVRSNVKHIALTSRYEGGRNTPRGASHYID